jgi:hypothetical protein
MIFYKVRQQICANICMVTTLEIRFNRLKMKLTLIMLNDSVRTAR